MLYKVTENSIGSVPSYFSDILQITFHRLHRKITREKFWGYSENEKVTIEWK